MGPRVVLFHAIGILGPIREINYDGRRPARSRRSLGSREREVFSAGRRAGRRRGGAWRLGQSANVGKSARLTINQYIEVRGIESIEYRDQRNPAFRTSVSGLQPRTPLALDLSAPFGACDAAAAGVRDALTGLE